MFCYRHLMSIFCFDETGVIAVVQDAVVLANKP